MDKKIIFTRYLYIYQEVCASLVVELLRNDEGANFENVLWWINELYYSGFHDELWCLCLKIYYWLYVDLYPNMEKYIMNQINLYINCKKEFVINEKNKDNQYIVEKRIIKLLLSTYKNLFTKRTNININTSKNAKHYHVVNSMMEKYGSIEEQTRKMGFKYSKGRKSRFVMNFIKYFEKNEENVLNIERKQKIKGFVEALEKNNVDTIYYFTSLYVQEKICEKMKTFHLLLELYAYISGVKNKDAKQTDIYLKRKRQLAYFELCGYLDDDIKHMDILLMTVAFDCYNLLHKSIITSDKDQKKISKKHIYVTASSKLIELFEGFNLIKTERETVGYRLLKEAHQLGHTRKIVDEVAIFTLNRDFYDDEELKSILWYNWDFYTSGCPLWEMRVREANGYYDDASKSVIFKEKEIDGIIDDSNQQLFYSKYGVEPDEQPQCIQDNVLVLNEVEETNKLVGLLSFSIEEKTCNREKGINKSLFVETCNKYDLDLNQINFGF
jgi:hypothetical protein